ncbi:unnamed protein product, partial [Staurois parvus]
ILHFQGRDLCVNNTDLSPVSFFTLLCIALHSRAIQSNVLTQVEHTQHTVKQHPAQS